MAPKALAPGVRFHPTDVELVKYYLQRKVTGKRIRFDVISEVDVYKFSPSDLPDKSLLKSLDLEWYFFCPRERKFVNGVRMNRATEYGFWKTTGRDRAIIFNDKTVGMIKTLIYHEGRAPKGNRTDWVMHEYRLEDENLANSGINQDAFVICKIFLKSGPGPRATQHLFKEDDWSDDDDKDTCINTFPSTDSSFKIAKNMNDPNCSTLTNLCELNNVSTDVSVEVRPLKSIKVLKGDSESVSLIEHPKSPKELPSMVTMQKDVSISELPRGINSLECGMQNNYGNHLQCQNSMHGNASLGYGGIPRNTKYLSGKMLGEGNCMHPSTSCESVVGFSKNGNHHGIVQSPSLDCPDLYKELENFFVPGVEPGYEESFIELDDLATPLDNKLHWSHLIPSDGLLNEVDQHGIEIPPLSVDDYGGSSWDVAPDSLLFTPQKDNADEIGNSSFFCTENWRQWMD